MIVLNKKQRTELSSLCADLRAMTLANIGSTDVQLTMVKDRLLRSLQPSIWKGVDFSRSIDREYAIILNDPKQEKIMVLLVLWPGNMSGQVHNHLTWAVVGVVHGIEESQQWIMESENELGNCHFVPSDKKIIHTGEALVLQDDCFFHSINNTVPQGHVCCSLHIYGQDLRTTGRQLFDIQTHTLVPNPNIEFITLAEYDDLSK